MPDENKNTTLADRMKAKGGLGRNKNLPTIFMVQLEQLRPNPQQPRQVFDDIAIQELANSIAKHGLLSPIIVMEDSDQVGSYIIITGERRYRAFKHLGREAIPAILRTEGNKAVLGLIENIQRENLEPFEEAQALLQLMEEEGLSQEELAEAVGRNKVSISESLSINRLPQEIRAEAQGDPRITRSFLIELARVKDQTEVWQTYKKHGLTVKDIRAIKKAEQKKANSDIRSKPKKKGLSAKKSKPIVSLVVSQAKSLGTRLTQAQDEKAEFTEEELRVLKDAYEKLTTVISKAEKLNSDVRIKS